MTFEDFQRVSRNGVDGRLLFAGWVHYVNRWKWTTDYHSDCFQVWLVPLLHIGDPVNHNRSIEFELPRHLYDSCVELPPGNWSA